MVWILYLKYHKILRTLALNFLMNYWLFEKVYQTLHSAFHPISRHLKVGLKKWVEGNLVWNHTRDFKSGRANKSQEYDFRPKLHVTKLNYHFNYYSHFEIAEFSQYQYLFDQIAGCWKRNKKAFTSHFVPEAEVVQYRAKMVRFKTEMRCFRTWVTRFRKEVI